MAESVLGPPLAKIRPSVRHLLYFYFDCQLDWSSPGIFATHQRISMSRWRLGLISFVAYNVYAFREQGLAYLKHFVGPLRVACATDDST